jgi:hypothetical protein
MNKHTPGPWEFDPNGGLPVIQIYCLDGKNPFHGHRSEEECAANARLMAASPDLLESLDRLQRAVDMYFGPSKVGEAWPTFFDAQMRAARAAIAKATGA